MIGGSKKEQGRVVATLLFSDMVARPAAAELEARSLMEEFDSAFDVVHLPEVGSARCLGVHRRDRDARRGHRRGRGSSGRLSRRCDAERKKS